MSVTQNRIKPETALLLINANSRRGQNPACDQLEHQLGQHLKIIRVDSQSIEETETAFKQHHDAVDRVIVAGGDGTVHSTLPLIRAYQLPLAIIPMGTANDLARTIDVHGDYERAIQVAVAGHAQRVDLGSVNDELFINVAHLGLGVRVTKRLDADSKLSWGVFSYLKAILQSLVRLRGFSAEITVDGHQHIVRSVEIAIGNGRFFGGGNIVDQASELDDGTLNLFSVPPRPVWQQLLLAPVLRSGRHRNDPRVLSANGASIQIRTKRSMAVHADGESVTHTPLDIRLLPGAIELCVPGARNA